MTREDAKEFDLDYYNGHMTHINDTVVMSRIDDIYDSFEQRTCESCRHFGEDETEWENGECPMKSIADKEKTYCYKWEKKDD